MVLERLREVAEFQFLNVATFASSDTLAQRLTAFGFGPLRIELQDHMVRADNKQSSCLLGNGALYKHLLSNGDSPEKAAEWLLSIADHLYDIRTILTSGIDPYLFLADRWRLTDLDGLFTRLRLLLVKHGTLTGSPRMLAVSKTHYYRYRLFRLFPQYQRAWIVASQPWIGASPEQVTDQLSSLGDRLEFVCRALDEGLIAALRTPNNDSDDELLYHLSVLVLLVSGAFDDLSWLATHFYGLPFTGQDVNIRHRDSRLIRALSSASPDLSGFLLSEDARTCIEGIYPLRDRVQHREFLHASAWERSRVRMTSLIAVPLLTLQRLSDCTSSPIVPFDQFGLDGSARYADPYWLLESIVKALVKVVNGMLPTFGWANRLSPNGEVSETLRRFEKGPGAYLDLGGEPILFD